MSLSQLEYDVWPGVYMKEEEICGHESMQMNGQTQSSVNFAASLCSCGAIQVWGLKANSEGWEQEGSHGERRQLSSLLYSTSKVGSAFKLWEQSNSPQLIYKGRNWINTRLIHLTLTGSSDRCQNQSCYSCGRRDIWLQMWISRRPAEKCQVLQPWWWPWFPSSSDMDIQTRPVGDSRTILFVWQYQWSLLHCQGGQNWGKRQRDILVWDKETRGCWWYQSHTA